jgi:hypothetical protein
MYVMEKNIQNMPLKTVKFDSRNIFCNYDDKIYSF